MARRATTGLVFSVVCVMLVACEQKVVRTESVSSEIDDRRLEEPVVVEPSNSQPSDEEVLSTLRLLGMEVSRNASGVTATARMKMKDLMFSPLMIVPQLIIWGFAPVLLANLKLFVMHIFMLNQMALSSAIYMTLRNIVFGPRPGGVVKYHNHGYGPNQFHHHHRRIHRRQ